MIDKDKYYNATKASEETKVARARLADEHFNKMMTDNRALFDDIVSLIKEKVDDGDASMTYLPHDESYYQWYIQNHRLIPDKGVVFSTEQSSVFYLLRAIGYKVDIAYDKLYFDGMTALVDQPVQTQIARISWNG